jgi:hypothetical protein
MFSIAAYDMSGFRGQGAFEDFIVFGIGACSRQGTIDLNAVDKI